MIVMLEKIFLNARKIYCQVLRGVPAPRLPRQHAGRLDRAAGGGVRGARHHLQRTPQHPQVPRDRAGQ